MTSNTNVYKHSAGTQSVLILSSFHDFRSKKRSSIHHVAAALVSLGYDVSFVSTRYSNLSRLNNDSREFLRSRANQVEVVDGVKCYLWKTVIHPFSSRYKVVNRLMNSIFYLNGFVTDPSVDRFLTNADFLIFESGASVLLLERARRLNPEAYIVYYAADLLTTVGAHPYINKQLVKWNKLINHVSVRSSKMTSGLEWASKRVYKAEFGINPLDYDTDEPSPFFNGCNAVSVGSMLFDRSFFTSIAPLFPEVMFHVIGSGCIFEAPENVRIYPEMAFSETLKFIKYADVGLAPYLDAPGVEYLAESSLKLAQYQFFGIPAVCPSFAAGHWPDRFGYNVGNIEEMKAAMDNALAAKTTPRAFPTWKEVAQGVLHPNQSAMVKME